MEFLSAMFGIAAPKLCLGAAWLMTGQVWRAVDDLSVGVRTLLAVALLPLAACDSKPPLESAAVTTHTVATRPPTTPTTVRIHLPPADATPAELVDYARTATCPELAWLPIPVDIDPDDRRALADAVNARNTELGCGLMPVTALGG